MWLRDFRSPPKALALFQIYHRFAPLTDFRGLTWRMQVDQDVCLQAYLVAGPSQGSFIHVRRGPTLAIQPPLMRIEGQLEANFVNELPLESWIAQGTRWWLRNLGSVLVDKPLRLTLLNGLLDMDRLAYPEVEAAIAYHPIVPLVDGSWISLDQLSTYPQIFRSKTWTRGWHGGVPVIQCGGALDQIEQLIDQPVVALEGPPPHEIIRWSYPLQTDCGLMTLANLGPEHYRSSNWVIGNPREPRFCCATLFENSPLSLCITGDYRGPMPEFGLPPELRTAVCKAILGAAGPIVNSLAPFHHFHEICSLLVLMLQAGAKPPEEIWSLHFNSNTSLGHVREGKAYPLGQFRSDHPIFLLVPGNLGLFRVDPEAAPRTDLFQLRWTQACGPHEVRLQFLARRDGLSAVTVCFQGHPLEQWSAQLWEDWPLSLSIDLQLSLRPDGLSVDDWSQHLKNNLETNWETPLRLLKTYPEALEEVCCMVGMGLQTGRRPPSWIWDFQDLQGRSLGELIQGGNRELHSHHPLRRLQKLLKR